MLEIQQFIFFSEWIYGIAFMVHFHNFFVSVLLYKARNSNGSNILKIIVNFTGMITFLCKFLLNATPSVVSTLGCKLLLYVANIDNLIYRGALAIFLLWRLKQIGPMEYDKWISIALVIARTAAHAVYLAFLNPGMFTLPSSIYTFYKTYNQCTYDNNKALTPLISFIVVDGVIDIYVTVRLVMILQRANKNAAQVSSNIDRRTKRTLFTAVMYWNFVRSLTALGQNVVALLITLLPINTYGNNYDDAATRYFFQTFCFVLTSYVVTVDAEIVRVIEGKDQGGRKVSNNSGSKKSYPGTPATRLPPGYKKYSSSTQSDDESHDVKFNVSMKRLSFFEWANMVVGFRREDSNKHEFEKGELEEILDGPLEATNLDPEKRNSNLKRSSDISGTSTVISTTTASTMSMSSEHDIV